MDDANPAQALEECRALCKQLLSGPSLRRTPSDVDTVCVSSADPSASFFLSEVLYSFFCKFKFPIRFLQTNQAEAM
jgi:hypothetical protein